jgi:hypothetical protein
VSPANKKLVSIFFKAAIILLAFGFIYQKLTHNENLKNFKTLAANLNYSAVVLVVGVILLLMLANWTIEAVKWKYLLKKIELISLWKSIESVFCGLTWAVFTPNRIGEYGGRVFFLSPRKRVFGVIAMAVGSIGQMVITNIFGAIAILWFLGRFMDINMLLFYALVFVVIFFCSFFLFFYFNIRLLDGLLSKVSFLKKFRRFFHILAKFKKADLAQVILYCLSRFLVFTTQYCLIIQLLIPEMAILDMVMMIFILFFIQSALPSLDLLDVGVRSMTATYFFGFITSQEIAIMAATTLIWLVNLIIPAILGSVFVLKLNFFGKSDN